MRVNNVEFLVNSDVETIFREEAITSFSSVCLMMEQYKFLARAEIVHALNQSKQFTDIVVSKAQIERSAEFEDSESKFNILVEDLGHYNVAIYYAVDAPIRKEAIELKLNKYTISYFPITPYNYYELLDPELHWVTYNTNILFKRILIEALTLKATDLHFCVEHVDLKATYPIKYRKDGELYRMNLFELNEDLNSQIITRLIEKKTSANSADLQTPAGVTTVADDPLGNHQIELRVAANRVKNGLQCVIRIQTKETFNFNIENLGFDERVQGMLRSLTKKRSGIILITGAIRTGKNTTAFAVLNEIADQPVKIVSYESPIEVLMPFTQVDYMGDEESLANAVRLAKKQDVNLAYLNEIPNKEVAFAVQDLVNSSICVLTTMHVNRLWHLPYKLKEYYGASYKDVISQIDTVINQKMFGVTCKECREKCLTKSLDPKLSNFLLSRGVEWVYANTGCDACKYTGRENGRNQPYVEYLEFNEEIKDKLLACSEPFEMENVLRDAVRANKTSLEDTMLAAIVAGDLSTDSLYHIL